MAKRKVRNDLVFLEDILECIIRILEYPEGLTEREFKENQEIMESLDTN